MTITNCPKCGSMNITTAGVCANCGWSQFTTSTVSTGARVVEWEEEMSERLKMECKRCGDNEDRIDGFCSKECKDKYSLEEALSKMSIRIDELEALVEQLIWVGNDLLVSNTNPVTITLFNGLVCSAKEREKNG